MESTNNRTIPEVMNLETGEYILANDFFKKDIDAITRFRSELNKVIQGIREPLFVCCICKQNVKIRGGYASTTRRKSEIFHFAHLKDSEYCPIKTKTRLSKEEVDRIKYNGQTESKRHIQLKEQIAECLLLNQKSKNEVSDIQIEQVINNKIIKEWKKPDINALFLQKRIALELQLSTTWLDVITRRQEFYKNEGIFIIWIFNEFNFNDFQRKLTYNDVIYTNNQNAFLFDAEAYELSLKQNDLILKCYFMEYYNQNWSLGKKWSFTIISLSNLKFDNNSYKLYYHNSDAQKVQVENEIASHELEIKETEKRKRLLEAKRNIKLKAFENEIEVVLKEISKLKEIKKGIDDKELLSKIKINDIKLLLDCVSEYTQNLLINFYDPVHNFNPIPERKELYVELKNKFAEHLISTANVLKDMITEHSQIQDTLEWLNSLQKVEISNCVYNVIDNKVDWNFIKNHFKRIKIINKNSINSLFVETRNFENEFELNKYQHTKDFLFLIDLQSTIKEFNDKCHKKQEDIKTQKAIIDSMKNEITANIEFTFQNELKGYEENIKKNHTDLTLLHQKVESKENELATIRHKMHKFSIRSQKIIKIDKYQIYQEYN